LRFRALQPQSLPCVQRGIGGAATNKQIAIRARIALLATIDRNRYAVVATQTNPPSKQSFSLLHRKPCRHCFAIALTL